MLELRLGLGGISYYEFITSVHLPTQLAEVDPIVASFCGGAVGVLTSLLVRHRCAVACCLWALAAAAAAR